MDHIHISLPPGSLWAVDHMYAELPPSTVVFCLTLFDWESSSYFNFGEKRRKAAEFVGHGCIITLFNCEVTATQCLLPDRRCSLGGLGEGSRMM